MKAFKRIAKRFTFLLLLLPLNACAISGDALDGKVLDESTNQPIPGAIVVVRWQGNIGGPVDSSTICYHVETATTDEQGRFHTNAWKGTEADIGLHPKWYDRLFGANIRDETVMKDAYKPGYVFGTMPTEDKTVWLKLFTGTKVERFEYLRRSTVSCHQAGESKKNLVPLAKALYEEALSLAKTEDEKKTVNNLLFSLEIIELGYEAAERRDIERSRGQK